MLTLRLQRTGRKKLAQYRLVAQEHQQTPTSGKVSARLGNYDPHTKEVNFDKEKVEFYLQNGAQPSNKVAKILKAQGYKLPSWVKIHERPEKKKEESEEAPAVAETTAEAPAPEAETKEEPAAPEAEKAEAEEVETKEETKETE